MPAIVTPEKLLESLEQGMADIAEALQQAKALDMLETALADAIENISKRPGVDLSPLVKALQDHRPIVNVNVPQQPAPVVQIVPVATAKWELTKRDAYGNAVSSITLERVA